MKYFAYFGGPGTPFFLGERQVSQAFSWAVGP